MQAALCFSPSHFPLLTPTKTSILSPSPSPSPWKISIPRQQQSSSSLRSSIRATALPNDDSSVDYSSITSVFPAEACETIGGEACGADIYPEVKIIKSEATAKTSTASEPVDREYLEYDNPKTVFPDEACDDLGGEFCEPEYQKGVYK